MNNNFLEEKNISQENDDNSNNNTNIDDLENYFINSGFFLKNEDNKKKEKEKEKNIYGNRLSMIPHFRSKFGLKSNTAENLEENNSQKNRKTLKLKTIDEIEIKTEEKKDVVEIKEEDEDLYEKNGNPISIYILGSPHSTFNVTKEIESEIPMIIIFTMIYRSVPRAMFILEL